jgi:2-polyprenyl-3-methyl-5-hydroxy-6-metoxy-1,4-benzoquinol methylase
VQEHWEKIYRSKLPDEVSWYRPHLDTSLDMIEFATHGDRTASIIDVGGGASTLVDDLVERGYKNVTVLDISQAALDLTRSRLAKFNSLQYIIRDVTKPIFAGATYDVWHDRAVFHFLTSPQDRQAYVCNVATAVRPGGHIILSTFGPEGPAKCSGLDVVRYSADELHSEFGTHFQLIQSSMELHRTPFGTTQQFVYCLCSLERTGNSVRMAG